MRVDLVVQMKDFGLTVYKEWMGLPRCYVVVKIQHMGLLGCLRILLFRLVKTCLVHKALPCVLLLGREILLRSERSS